MMMATAIRMAEDLTLALLEDGTIVQMTTEPDRTAVSIWPRSARKSGSFNQLIETACSTMPLTGHIDGPVTDIGETIAWFMPEPQPIQVETYENPSTDDLDLLASAFSNAAMTSKASHTSTAMTHTLN